ncbi:MAG: apolipoprotein N-acyltransferase [Bacteroidales bacterium]|nr:apolipoprotein N-acyltransferase [Bacteroidales bacterium]
MPYLLAVLSGVIASLSWIADYTSIVLVIALVPLLFAEHLVANSMLKHKMLATALVGILFIYTFQWIAESPLKLQFSWWMYHLYFLLVSLLFVAFFTLFALVKKRLGNKVGYIAFVCLYICFEYLLLTLNDITFPVLMLGNSMIGIEGFGIRYIQWYEYTGVLGGTLWILVCDVLFFLLIRNRIEKRKLNPYILSSAIVVFVLPLVASLLIFATYKEKKAPVEFVLVQPNYNPYTEKFTVPVNDQRDRMISLAEAEMTDNTDFVVFPETALDSNFWYNNIEENGMLQYLRDSVLSKHEGLKLITGVPMMQYYVAAESPSIDAVFANDSIFIEKYNAAILIDKDRVQTYKKNIPVPFSERMPFVSIFPFLAKYTKEEKGSFLLNNAQGKEQNVFSSTKTNIGCFICYEGIYGEYCTNFIKNGADLLCTVANDGWWLKSHFMYAHLRAVQIRAIENRRSIVRSDNTGFTVGIDQRGYIVKQAPWWEATAINVTLNKNKKKTIYSQLGDYIGVLDVFVSIFIVGMAIYKMIRKK